METKLRAAALCSMIAMATLAGVYVYQDISLPLARAFGSSAGTGLLGALIGWRIASAMQRPGALPKGRQAAPAASQA